MNSNIIVTVLLLAAFVLSSCGGGGSSANIAGDTQASITGNLSVDNGVKGSSSLGGLDGGEVSVINSDGELQATTQTDSSGNFNLTGLQEGENLLKVEFDSEYQLGQDGSNQVELLFPVTVVGGNNTVDGDVYFQDLDGDGVPDGLQLTTVVNNDEESRLVEPEPGIVRIDFDSDGEFDDEVPLRDLDGDGLPEDAHGSDNSLHGGILKGPIQSISDTEIVVNGVMFLITDATRFKDKGNKSPDMDVFQEGTNVHIRGMWNGEEWTAIEIKTTGVRGMGDDDDDDDGDDDDGGDDGDGDDGDGGDGGDDGSGFDLI